MTALTASESATRPRTGRDLAEMATTLERRFRGIPPYGYLLGKTIIRNAVMELLKCSAMRAEELVDRMQARGFLHYEGDPREAGGGRAPWQVVTRPRSLV